MKELRILITFGLLLAIGWLPLGESQAFFQWMPNRPTVTSFAGGSVYVRAVPAQAEGSEGTTKIYEVTGETDQLVGTYDWFNYYGVDVARTVEQKGGEETKKFHYAVLRKFPDDDTVMMMYLDGRLLMTYDVAYVDKLNTNFFSHTTDAHPRAGSVRFLEIEYAPHLNNSQFWRAEIEGAGIKRYDVMTGEEFTGAIPEKIETLELEPGTHKEISRDRDGKIITEGIWKNSHRWEGTFFEFDNSIGTYKEGSRVYGDQVKPAGLTLNIVLNHPQEYYKGKEMTVLYQVFNNVYDPQERKFPVASSVTIPDLTGEYEVTVFVPGAARPDNQYVKVVGNPGTLTFQLPPGSDLKFDVVDAEGKDISNDIVPELSLKDYPHPRIWDREHRGEGNSYRGLPPGEYVLNIYSKEDYPSEEDRLKGYSLWGQMVPFVIEESSPEVVDLGKIAFNKPAAADTLPAPLP